MFIIQSTSNPANDNIMELLIIADKCEFPIKEVPVRWTDDPDTRVKVISTAIYDLCGLARLKFGGLRLAKSKLK